MNTRSPLKQVTLVLCLLPLLMLSRADAKETLSYNRDIRPILSKNCFACHGPDEETREADLRLDVEGDGDGDVDFDEIVARITSGDPDVQMPPPSFNKKLSERDVAALTAWINGGAQYEEHWAFIKPSKPTVPTNVHPVDYFVDEKLKSASLARAPLANPYTRIRRVYLDLIGVPPPVEIADAFASNPSESAYEATVDSLLESPKYGERWARPWLDLARYADTNGYEKDRDRTIWPYRDWVIRAINDDMPFDQFTIEQLAGDMLPGATASQRIATGFHRNTMLNEEGGIDPLEFRFHAMTDRVATTGTTWLGLTLGCAQCHTHKYDPITHVDYYGIMAYLNNADEPEFYVSTDSSHVSTDQSKKENLQLAEKLMVELESHWPNPKEGSQGDTFETALQKWIDSQRALFPQPLNWQTIVPQKMSANIPYLTAETNGVIFAGGDTSKHDIYTLDFSGQATEITSLRLEALPDDRLPDRGPGMTYYEGRKGDFFLAEFQLTDVDGKKIPIANASETYFKNQFGKSQTTAKHTIDGDLQTGWSIAEGAGVRHVAVFNLDEPIKPGTPFTLRMDFGRHFASSLGCFRLSMSGVDGKPVASTLSNEIVQQIHASDAAANPKVREAFMMQSLELKPHADKIRNLRKAPVGTKTLVLRERPAGHSRETRLHHRGEYTQPKKTVSPQLPDALLAEDQTIPLDRLEFARWIVSPENPLTARVVTNRAWAKFFGTGIVDTLDYF